MLVKEELVMWWRGGLGRSGGRSEPLCLPLITGVGHKRLSRRAGYHGYDAWWGWGGGDQTTPRREKKQGIVGSETGGPGGDEKKMEMKKR